MSSLSAQTQWDIEEPRWSYSEQIEYHRTSSQLSESTIEKTVECLLCLLAFARNEKHLEPELSLLEDVALVQEYARLIRNRCALKSVTLSWHDLLFKCGSFFPEPVTVLSGLKALQHQLEKSGCKEGRLARAQKDDTKTVMYPELLEICRQCQSKFEVTTVTQPCAPTAVLYGKPGQDQKIPENSDRKPPWDERPPW